MALAFETTLKLQIGWLRRRPKFTPKCVRIITGKSFPNFPELGSKPRKVGGSPMQTKN
jgi:hypothetical protein